MTSAGRARSAVHSGCWWILRTSAPKVARSAIINGRPSPGRSGSQARSLAEIPGSPASWTGSAEPSARSNVPATTVGAPATPKLSHVQPDPDRVAHLHAECVGDIGREPDAAAAGVATEPLDRAVAVVQRRRLDGRAGGDERCDATTLCGADAGDDRWSVDRQRAQLAADESLGGRGQDGVPGDPQVGGSPGERVLLDPVPARC